jgi:catechol 2,3-dioxygenase-like lactoylglutathione lyase family enzyme
VFDHVTIRVSDRAASDRFYTTVLRTMGVEPSYAGEDFVEWDPDGNSAEAVQLERPRRRGAIDHPCNHNR